MITQTQANKLVALAEDVRATSRETSFASRLSPAERAELHRQATKAEEKFKKYVVSLVKKPK